MGAALAILLLAAGETKADGPSLGDLILPAAEQTAATRTDATDMSMLGNPRRVAERRRLGETHMSATEIATFTLREIAVTLALCVLAALAAVFALGARDGKDERLHKP